jgi:hypothetical protein
MSQYVIRTVERCYLSTFFSNGSDPAVYAWTAIRANARRYGRADALTTATALDEAIKQRGCQTKPVRIEPATGGMTVVR